MFWIKRIVQPFGGRREDRLANSKEDEKCFFKRCYQFSRNFIYKTTAFVQA